MWNTDEEYAVNMKKTEAILNMWKDSKDNELFNWIMDRSLNNGTDLFDPDWKKKHRNQIERWKNSSILRQWISFSDEKNLDIKNS